MACATVSKKSGKTYHLHSKQVTLRGGHKQTIYYCAGSAGSNAMDNLPSGYQVVENPRTGLPLLNPNPPKDTDGRREDSGRGWVRELQGRWPGVMG